MISNLPGKESAHRHTATHCITHRNTSHTHTHLTCGASWFAICRMKTVPTDTATHCNTLQHTATHCNTLQHTATHCNTLQHTPQHTTHTHTWHAELHDSQSAGWKECRPIAPQKSSAKYPDIFFFKFSNVSSTAYIRFTVIYITLFLTVTLVANWSENFWSSENFWPSKIICRISWQKFSNISSTGAAL